MSGVVAGWMRCAFGICGTFLLSGYSTLTVLRVDDTSMKEFVAEATVPTGRHWIEVQHTWGAGVITGIGNWNNFGFELDVAPGHRYQVDSLPAGCAVPFSKRHVNRKVLTITESAPGEKDSAHAVEAMEFCTPHKEAGTCRTDDECAPGTCAPFNGTTGFGMCSDKEHLQQPAMTGGR